MMDASLTHGFYRVIVEVGCHDWYPISVCNNTVHESPLNTKADLEFVPCLGPNASCTWANDLDKTEAINFITRANSRPDPWFLYLSTTTPHAGFLHGSGAKPELYANAYPVPYPFNKKFAEMEGKLWTDAEKLFASAVWAQDVMVGAVLDHLDALNIAQKTLVIFSGDNGPDGPGFQLFDDPGFFRGKKRSLHEGGVRQTIVMQWPGVLAAGQVAHEIFIFYDLMATALDLAGVPKTKWPETDGQSAVPIFEAHAVGAAPSARPTSLPPRFLYWEFCHTAPVDGLLPQSYATGWSQSLRWDDDGTEWKAIASNSDYSNVLLYNLTADQSESVPLAGTPVGPDAAPRSSLSVDPVVAQALAHAVSHFHSEHVENQFWKKSANASDPCCNSCFAPAGCAFPCKRFGPAPPPPPPAQPIPIEELPGAYTAREGHGTATFELKLGPSAEILISNPADKTSCWTAGNGTYDSEAAQIEHVRASSSSCVRLATGTVRRTELRQTVDVDYQYAAQGLEITWQVTDGPDQLQTSGTWPVWVKKQGDFRPVE